MRWEITRSTEDTGGSVRGHKLDRPAHAQFARTRAPGPEESYEVLAGALECASTANGDGDAGDGEFAQASLTHFGTARGLSGA